jgi:hypothetical protein
VPGLGTHVGEVNFCHEDCCFIGFSD